MEPLRDVNNNLILEGPSGTVGGNANPNGFIAYSGVYQEIDGLIPGMTYDIEVLVTDSSPGVFGWVGDPNPHANAGKLMIGFEELSGYPIPASGNSAGGEPVNIYGGAVQVPFALQNFQPATSYALNYSFTAPTFTPGTDVPILAISLWSECQQHLTIQSICIVEQPTATSPGPIQTGGRRLIDSTPTSRRTISGSTTQTQDY